MTEDPAPEGRLELREELTIWRIEATHKLLSEHLSAHSNVIIDCRDAEAIDLSFIQLLIAARHSAHELGKVVTLAGPMDGVLGKTLSRAGFVSVEEDHGGSETFWFTGAGA